MRWVVPIVLAAFLASPANSAERITCVSLDGLQRIDIYVEFDEGRYAGRIARVDIPTEEVTLTSEADAEGRPGLIIALPEVDQDTIAVSLEDPRNVHILADLQISRAVAYTSPEFPENDEHVVAVGGTLSLAGIGVWVVTCTGWN